MSRYISLNEFRKRYEVVDPHDLAAREPFRDYDPFIEQE